MFTLNSVPQKEISKPIVYFVQSPRRTVFPSAALVKVFSYKHPIAVFGSSFSKGWNGLSQNGFEILSLSFYILAFYKSFAHRRA
jgi:hypothetical protein